MKYVYLLHAHMDSPGESWVCLVGAFKTEKAAFASKKKHEKEMVFQTWPVKFFGVEKIKLEK